MADTTELADAFRARVQNYSLEALGNWAYSHRVEIEAALRASPAAEPVAGSGATIPEGYVQVAPDPYDEREGTWIAERTG